MGYEEDRMEGRLLRVLGYSRKGGWGLIGKMKCAWNYILCKISFKIPNQRSGNESGWRCYVPP